MFEIVSIFIFFFTRLAIGNRVRALSDVELNPSSFFPVEIEFKINAKLPRGSIEVYLVIKDSIDFLELSVINLDTTNTGCIIKHFTSQLNKIFPCLFHLQNGQLPLSNQHNNRNGRLIARDTDTHVGVIRVHEDFPFLIHLQE